MSEKQVKRNRRAHGIKFEMAPLLDFSWLRDWDGKTFAAPTRWVSRDDFAEAIYNVEPTQVPMCADPECEICGGPCFYGLEGD